MNKNGFSSHSSTYCIALRFYDVKGFGFAEVEQLYGIETMRNAADKLKNLYEGKGKMKLKLFISLKGVRLYDQATLVGRANMHLN